MNVKRVLCQFSKCLCLQVNFHKSCLTLINFDKDYAAVILNFLMYKGESLPLKYLGLPLGSNPKRISTWKLILLTIRTRLQS
jgi:hypothetical protein